MAVGNILSTWTGGAEAAGAFENGGAQGFGVVEERRDGAIALDAGSAAPIEAQFVGVSGVGVGVAGAWRGRGGARCWGVGGGGRCGGGRGGGKGARAKAGAPRPSQAD